MKIEEIVYELRTLYAGAQISHKEQIAARQSIPIIKRCEKYRKALEKIKKALPPENTEQSYVIAGIVAESFDCEEE